MITSNFESWSLLFLSQSLSSICLCLNCLPRRSLKNKEEHGQQKTSKTYKEKHCRHYPSLITLNSRSYVNTSDNYHMRLPYELVVPSPINLTTSKQSKQKNREASQSNNHVASHTERYLSLNSGTEKKVGKAPDKRIITLTTKWKRVWKTEDKDPLSWKASLGALASILIQTRW